MMFKNSLTIKGKRLNRGDSCAYYGTKATYLGSYDKDGDGWNHLIMINTVSGDEILIVKSIHHIVFKKMETKKLKGQLCLC